MYAYEKKTEYSYNFGTIKELSYICRRNGINIPVREDVAPLSAKPQLRLKNGDYLTLSNSIAVNPMECLDFCDDGSPSFLSERRWLRFASSGAGLIYCGTAALDKDCRQSGRQLLITRNNIHKYKILISKMRAVSSAPLIIQLSAGKINSKALAERFSAAVKLAFEAGFDGVDIKLCHGDILCTSPDAGSVFDSIIDIAPHNAVISCRYGLSENTEKDAEAVLSLYEKGLSVASVTSGSPYKISHLCFPSNISEEKPPEHPLKSLERLICGAAEIKKAAPGLCVIASGMSYLKNLAPYVAAEVIALGKSDMVGFGRAAIAATDFASNFISGKTELKTSCIACGKCSELLCAEMTVGCPIRDQEIYLPLYRELRRSKTHRF